MRTCLLVTFTLVLGSATGLSTQTQARNDIKDFVGTWRLVAIDENGKPVPARGPRPTGLMFLDANRNLSVQIMPDSKRPSWADGAEPTAEQAKAAFAGYSAFFGTFSIDAGKHTITYHRLGDIQPGNVGVDLVRHYESQGNRLTVTPEDYPNRRITWELVR